MVAGEGYSQSMRYLLYLLKVGAHKGAHISHVEKPDACKVFGIHSRKGELQTFATLDRTGFLFLRGIYSLKC